MENKSLRPYVCNLDWLQLFCQVPSRFDPERAPMEDLLASINVKNYTWQLLDHGSKVYKEIWQVKENGRDILCEVSLHPHKSNVRGNACAVKVANRVLYEPEPIQRIARFLNVYGIQFLSLTRVDMCYDFNEFYNGMRVESFIKAYMFKGKLVRYGAGTKVLPVMRQTYCVTANKDGKLQAREDEEVREVHGLTDAQGNPIKSNYEKEQERQRVYRDPTTLISLPDDRNPLRKMGKPKSANPLEVESITWGTRNAGHQVQLYNKTRELQQVKYKHHIAQSWQSAGLDLSRDVWRLEIRVTSEGLNLETIENALRHKMSLSDLLLQEQIETIFNDYANKYFRFYILSLKDHRSEVNMRDMSSVLKHVSSLKEKKLLCCNNCMSDKPHMFIPRIPETRKDYTRSLALTLNVLEGALSTAVKADDPLAGDILRTLKYVADAYGVRKERADKALEYITRKRLEEEPQSMVDYLRQYWAGAETKWFDGIDFMARPSEIHSRLIDFCKSAELHLLPPHIAHKKSQQIIKDAGALLYEIKQYNEPVAQDFIVPWEELHKLSQEEDDAFTQELNTDCPF